MPIPMLINDLFFPVMAVLWCRQEGGEDRSSVGWQTKKKGSTDTGEAKGSSPLLPCICLSGSTKKFAAYVYGRITPQ